MFTEEVDASPDSDGANDEDNVCADQNLPKSKRIGNLMVP